MRSCRQDQYRTNCEPAPHVLVCNIQNNIVKSLNTALTVYCLLPRHDPHSPRLFRPHPAAHLPTQPHLQRALGSPSVIASRLHQCPSTASAAQALAKSATAAPQSFLRRTDHAPNQLIATLPPGPMLTRKGKVLCEPGSQTLATPSFVSCAHHLEARCTNGENIRKKPPLDQHGEPPHSRAKL